MPLNADLPHDGVATAGSLRRSSIGVSTPAHRPFGRSVGPTRVDPAAVRTPPSRALRYLPGTALVLDIITLTVVGALSVLGRDGLPIFQERASVSSSVSMAGPTILVVWIAAIALLGGYRKDLFGVGTDEYKRVVNGSLATAAFVGIACYLARFDLSRGFFSLVFFLGVPLLILVRFALRRALYRARKAGNLLQSVVISGTPSHVEEIASVLRRESWLGYQVIGALTTDHDRTTETPSGIPVLGGSGDVLRVVDEAEPDVIFFADSSMTTGQEMRRTVWELEHHAVRVVVAPRVADISEERVKVRPIGGLPLIHIEKPRTLNASHWAKRTFDIVGSLGLMLVFMPVFVVAALMVRLNDGGPVFFKQTRTGRGGAGFGCLKFRSMVVDAEELLSDLHVATGHDMGLFKMADDPRITAPGRFLRRFSFDELPQLLNVLRGDMSLVGPRPGLPHEVACYTPDVERRLRVRPGMTGLWQVSGRSDLSFDEAVRLDLYYVDNWSMLQDLTILMRTFGAVFGTRGAY